MSNHSEAVRFFNDGGNERFRFNYSLSEKSIIFDLGGYIGDWSEQIFEKYNCTIYVFEPVKLFYDDIVKKFQGNEKIKVFNFGLSDKNEKIKISLSGDGSSIHCHSYEHEEIMLVDILEFINKQEINKIDLIKINVEGEEYNILERLLRANKIQIILDIQVQFHNFIQDCVSRRDVIRKLLTKTHLETYCYEFVWENWRIKQ